MSLRRVFLLAAFSLLVMLCIAYAPASNLVGVREDALPPQPMESPYVALMPAAAPKVHDGAGGVSHPAFSRVLQAAQGASARLAYPGLKMGLGALARDRNGNVLTDPRYMRAVFQAFALEDAEA